MENLGIETINALKNQVTLEELKRLRKVTKREYDETGIPEAKRGYQSLVVYTRGNALHPSSLWQLHSLHPESFTLLEGLDRPFPDARLKNTFKINLNLFLAAANTIKTHNLIVGDTPEILMSWLPLFYIYKHAFYGSLSQYKEDPDLGVEIESGALEEDVAGLKLIVGVGEYDDYDCRATCHLLIISMLKSFHSVDNIAQTQLEAYLRQRKKAVYASMRRVEGKFMLKDSFLLRFGDVMQALPKLRITLFRFAMAFEIMYPELGASITLLRDTAMTTINAMLEFIKGDPLVVAHGDRRVWGNISKFMHAINAKKEALGDYWPFFRILDPYDTSLQVSNFPYLAAVSLEWKKTFGQSTFKQVQSSVKSMVPINLLEDARKKTRKLKRTETEGGLTPEELNGAEMALLDITAWRSQEDDVDQQEARQENILDQLAQILRDKK